MDMLVPFGGDMMIEYYEGTVFNSGAKALVNTVNTVGVMGAGIALEFKLRFPDMYIDYKRKCDEGKFKVGKIDYFRIDNSNIVVNFPTKAHFKYPSKMIWIEKGLQNFIDTYKEHDIESIAFPKLGAGNGGLNWEKVKQVMEEYLKDLDIEVIICLDEKCEAEGVEKEMLNKFNTIDLYDLGKKIRLSTKQKELIAQNRPFDRFWKLINIESIGIKTYDKIFSCIYDGLNKPVENTYIQPSFFDIKDIDKK